MSGGTRRAAAAGVRWTTASTAITLVLQLAQLAILTRLLGPEEFGLMGMLMVALGFGVMFADMGMGNALIYRQDATDEQQSTLYWLNWGAGLLIFAVMMATTGLVARVFAEPRLVDLLPWAAVMFLITPLGQQYQALLQKELRFNTLAAVAVGSSLAGVVVAVSTALAGAGVYALIWGQLTLAATRSVWLFVRGVRDWRPRLHFRRSDLEGYLGFGVNQLAEKTFIYFAANMDYLLVGRILGSEVLGVYYVAYEIAIRPVKKINPVFTRVAFPVFARRQNENKVLARGYTELSRLIATVLFPILLGLAVTAPMVVEVAFGDGWAAAAPLLQVLALVGMFKALGNPVGSILLAKGRPDIGLWWNVATTILNFAVFSLAARWGVYALAWSFVGVSALYFVGWRYVLHSLIGLRWKPYASALVAPLLIAVAMAVVVLLARDALAAGLQSPEALLAILVPLGAAVYLGVWLVADRPYVSEVWSLATARERRPTEAA